MRMEFDTNGKQHVNVHYVNTPIPCVVEENFGEYYDDHDDFSLAQVLQDQETVYQSLQRNGQINVPRVSSSTNSRANQDCRSAEERNSSDTLSVDPQIANDEALARELQEMEDQFAGTSLGESSVTETGTINGIARTENGRTVAGTSAQVSGEEDDVDPDTMTYEELQSLGEAIGAESRGLSDELISYLPSCTYKTGLFSKKDKQECVICYMAYKNRDRLIILPCQHRYHKDCITRWLKINKACPVCTEEVFGS